MKIKISWLCILLVPAISFSQSEPKTKMYGDGNTSIKINDSTNYLSNAVRRIWLENSALAFSANEEELYFRHPTDKYFQIWSVASKQKLSEITFSEAGNTTKGRAIIAAFPNTIYHKDEYTNSKIWLSPDLYITFGNRNNFTISDGQNQTEKSFTLKLRESIDKKFSSEYNEFYRKGKLENIRYQIYYHKISNKIFIIAYANQVGKMDYVWSKGKHPYSIPYNGIFSFDLSNNILTVLAENPTCGDVYERLNDKWYFLNDVLIRRFVEEKNSFYSRFNLLTLNQQDLEKATKYRYLSGDVEQPESWKNPIAGIDLQGNVYLVNPYNNHIEIYYFDKLNTAKGTLATILNSSGKLNEVYYQYGYKSEKHNYYRNVLAMSPSGKNIAYLCLNNRNTVGNYASIMLYNFDENDRVYTLNDQTKYQPYIAKGYRTNKDSEEIELAWQKIEDEKKKQGDVAKLERKKRYTTQIDELKAQFLELKKERHATLKEDIDFYTLGDYKAVLVRNKWTASQTYKPYSNSPASHNFNAKEDVEFRYNSNGVYAVIKETLKFPVTKKTDKHLLLTGDPGFYDGYVDGVTKGEQYITSNCDANLVDWNQDEFRINTDAYPYCNVKGLDILDQGQVFKEFGKRYHGSLMKAKFKLKLLSDNTFILSAQTTSGVSFVLEIPKTNIQITLDRKMDDLRKEINNLETIIENGN
jgi:hypothetical protein